MTSKRFVRSAARGMVVGAGLAAGAYAAYVGTAWLRYGRAHPRVGDEQDPLLERFIPAYEVVERHSVHVAAPAHIAFAAACEVDLQRSGLVRAIFKGREVLLGSCTPDGSARPRGLLALTKSLGWGVLAEVPGREVVVGAVTQPWKGDVVFRALAPDAFAAFDEPDFAKIVWTLRADPLAANESVARTETRVVTTDAAARRKFRRYWSLVSPGIVIIRREALRSVKAEAERIARRAATGDQFKLVSVGDPDPQC